MSRGRSTLRVLAGAFVSLAWVDSVLAADCMPPRITPSSQVGIAQESIEFSLPDAGAKPTAVRLSVVAREPEGRQLARGEAVLSANATDWRPALNTTDLSQARVIKLFFELQSDCGNERSSTTRHQKVVDASEGCELATAPVWRSDTRELSWARMQDATSYEVCLQQTGADIRCIRTSELQHQFDRDWTASDAAAVTPHCRRGVGPTSVVRTR